MRGGEGKGGPPPHNAPADKKGSTAFLFWERGARGEGGRELREVAGRSRRGSPRLNAPADKKGSTAVFKTALDKHHYRQ